MPKWEPEADGGLWALSDPRLRKKCCYSRRRTWGQYSSQSPSPTHLSQTTTITLSRIKCERYIFIKKCIRSFIEVRILCLIMSRFIFVCMWLYNIATKAKNRVVRVHHSAFSWQLDPWEFILFFKLNNNLGVGG